MQQRNESRPGRNAYRSEHRGEQNTLVLAIAILILENFGGGMWPIAAAAEGKADVANISRDVIVERLHFFEIGCAAFGEFLRFGADFGSGISAALFQIGVPTRHFVPGVEGRELDVGNPGWRQFLA